MAQLEFDESLSRRLEAIYRTRDVLRRRRLVLDALAAASGERVLDVGCGPGFYVAEIAEAVEAPGAVVGLDASPEMLAVAVRRCEAPHVSFVEAAATSLPLDDSSFDAALSVQVLEYVPDVDAALSELWRVLRPGGRVVVWDVDWATVSVHSSDPELTNRVLRGWDAHLAHPSLPRTLAARLRAAGFADVRAEAHVFATIELTPEAYGGSVVPLIEEYVAGREDVGAADAARWGGDQRELGERGEFFFACVQFLFAATRPR